MVLKKGNPETKDYQRKRRRGDWLGSKDSNLDFMIQSHDWNF
jgi:hypothetical protein